MAEYGYDLSQELGVDNFNFEQSYRNDDSKTSKSLQNNFEKIQAYVKNEHNKTIGSKINLEAQLEQYVTKVNETENSINELKEQLMKDVAENESLKASFQTNKTEMENLKYKIDATNQLCKMFEKHMHIFSKKTSDVENVTKESETTTTALESEFTALYELINLGRKSLSQLKSDLEDSIDVKEECVRMVKEYYETILTSQKQELDEERKQNQVISEEIRFLKSKKHETINENEALGISLQNLQLIIGKLDDDLRMAVSELNENILAVQQEHKNLNMEINDKTEKIAMFENETCCLDRAIQQSKQNQIQVSSSISNMKDLGEEWKNKWNNENKNLMELTKLLDKRNEELTAMNISLAELKLQETEFKQFEAKGNELISELTCKMEELELLKTKGHKKIEELLHELDRLTALFNEERETNGNLRKEIDELEIKLQQNESIIRQARDDSENLQNNSQSSRERLEQVSSEKNEFLTTVQENNELLRQQGEKIRISKVNQFIFQKELSQAQEELKQQLEMTKSVNQKFCELERRIKEARNQWSQNQTHNINEIKKFEEQFKEISQKLSSTRKESDDKSEFINRYQSENSSVHFELKKEREKINLMAGNMDKENEEYNHTCHEYRKTFEENELLRGKIECLEKELQIEEENRKKLENTEKTMEGELSRQTVGMKSLSNKLQDDLDELSKENGEAEQLKSQLSQLKFRLDELPKLKEKLMLSEIKKKEYEADIIRLKNSVERKSKAAIPKLQRQKRVLLKNNPPVKEEVQKEDWRKKRISLIRAQFPKQYSRNKISVPKEEERDTFKDESDVLDWI